jgi:methionyl-tRNA synthetase
MTEKDQEFIAIYYKGYFSITKGRISAEPTSQCDECGMSLCPTDKHVHVHDIEEVEGIVRNWLEDMDRAWLVVREGKYGDADLIDVDV